MFYNYKNCTFKLSGIDVFASDVNLSIESKNNPIYREETKKNSYNYNQDDIPDCKFAISYYVTGTDLVRAYLLGGNSDQPISGNFCGLYFNSGYINSYTIKGAPDSIVKADIEISVFEPLKGSFTPTTPANLGLLSPLNFSNFYISGGFTGITFDSNTFNLLSFNYTLQRDITKYLREGYQSFSGDARAYVGRRNQNVSFELDNFDLTLPNSGIITALNISLRTTGNVTLDTLSLSGVLTSKKTSVSAQGYAKSEFNLKQDFSHFKPIITDFTPRYVVPGSTVTINGANFINVTNIYFGNAKASSFTNPSTILLTATVPTNVKGSVPISIETDESYLSTIINFKPVILSPNIRIAQLFSGL